MPVDSHRDQKRLKRDADGEFVSHDKRPFGQPNLSAGSSLSVERDADEIQVAANSQVDLALVGSETDLAHQDVCHQDSLSLSKFNGRDLASVLFVEVFAGSARLSRAVRDLNMRVLAVDHSAERAHGIHIANFDLAVDAQVNGLIEFLQQEEDNLAWIHFAPACGTASRARERPLPGLEAKGFRVAKPLRSLAHPEGLPGLQGTDKLRVEAANKVYSNTATIVRWAARRAITCSIENPMNSLFWNVPCIRRLLDDLSGYDACFDNCCHGGNRKKTTRWWSTRNWFQPLAVFCDDGHPHEPWRPSVINGRLTYPTAEEAAYPVLLCQRLAGILKDKLSLFGAVVVQSLSEQQVVSDQPLRRMVLDMLPRGRKYKPLVSEYGCYQRIVLFMDEPLNIAEQQWQLPAGARAVGRRALKWGEIRADPTVKQSKYIRERLHDLEDGDTVELHHVGIPREPLDFVEQAVRAGHPRSFAVHLPAEVVRVLEENVSDEDFALAKKRVAYLCRWTKRAQELGAEEQNLKKAMPGHQCCLLQRKRLLVFQEMLDDLGYPDKHLTRDLAAGFPLSGWLEPSGVFPRAVKRPQYSVDTLRVLAKGLNASILAQLENADDRDATNQQAWRQTLEEIEKGYVWLDEDADPSKHALAKRFGLNQKNKVRVIDDCTVGGLNKTIGVVEKYRIHAMDEISAYLAWMLTRCQARCQDSNGSSFQLLGRTFDLKAAYKQFGVNLSDRDLLRIAVRDTDCGRVRFLGINSLPFRVSMAVWFLGMVGLRLAWCAYFDDYTIFAKQSMATNATAAAEGLFQLLGLEFARDGSKACAFSTVFRTLGVEVDLDLFSKGQVSLGHTCERRLELQEVLKDVLDCGYVSSKQSESLRGRLHWFESFAFGRIANNAIKVLGNLAVKENKRNVLNASERLALTFLMERVGNARPLNLLPTSLCSWTVFTDGACEGAEQRMGSVGGVLFAPDGKCVSFFGGEAPADIMAHLLSFSANPIYELEIIPVLIAFAYWRHRFTGASVVFYIDNDAARSACIQASGATRHARSLMASVSRLEMECQCKAWYARVPTSSNIADAPSRLCFDQVEALGAVETEFRWTEVAEALGEESIGRFP